MSAFNEEAITRDELSRLDDAFQQATVQERAIYDPNLPDGYYEAEIEDVNLGRTTRTNNPMLTWRLRVVAGPHKGTSLVKTRVITEKTVRFLREDLQRLGISINRVSELPEHLEEMQDKQINIYKRANQEWGAQVYFVRNVAAGAAAANGGGFAKHDLDDLPF